MVKVLRLEQLIRDTFSFALSGSNVQADFDFVDDLWSVCADSGQLEQVIQNLVINACQAMPQGGRILVRAENYIVGEERDVPLPEGGKYVCFSVLDHGSGIDQDNLDRIFDPYFTTKSDGNGLGLAITHEIIKKHNGHISVQSKLGQGSLFNVFLPASEDALPDSHDNNLSTCNLYRGKILVMDDEEMVLETTAELLDFFGYSVTVAREGRQALGIYQEELNSSEPFDLVILDLTVPGGMGGEQTMQELLKCNPDVIGIATSGYCNNPVMAHFKDYGFSGVLPKPCKMEELKKLVDNFLARPGQ